MVARVGGHVEARGATGCYGKLYTLALLELLLVSYLEKCTYLVTCQLVCFIVLALLSIFKYNFLNIKNQCGVNYLVLSLSRASHTYVYCM